MFGNILEKILKYGLAAGLITPLVIGESLIFALTSTKAFFFYILVDVLLMSYLLLLHKKAIYPPKSKLFYFFILITLLGFVIDLFGINFKQSFWGNYERMVGIYTSLHILVYLWILLSVYNTKERFTRLLDVSVVVSFLVSIYGLLQNVGVHFFGIIELTELRVTSTIGNAAFLAGYLLIHLFLLAYLFYKKKGVYWRVFYCVVFLFDLVILFSTATRGALVGLAFAVLSMLVYLIVFYKNKKARFVGTVSFFLVVTFISSIFIFEESGFVKNNLALSRISKISLEESTTKSRLLVWKMSINASKDRPIFGYGDNNMRIPLDKYHDYALAEDWFDSSHNKFFDELLAHGVVGLLLYITFLLYVFWNIIRLRKSDFWLSLILFGLFAAYIVQSLFIFDAFVMVVMLSFILGFVFVLSNNDKKIFDKPLPGYIAYIFIPLIILATPVIYLRSIPPARDVISAYRVSDTDLSRTIELYTRAQDKLIYGYDVVAPAMAKTVLKVFSQANNYSTDDLKRLTDLLTQAYERAIDESKGYSKFYINLAKLYQEIDPVLNDVGLLDKSFPLLDKALEQSPNRVDIYYTLSQGYFNKGDYESAINTLNDSLKLAQRPSNVYLRLAEIYSRKGTSEEFIKAVDSINIFELQLSFKKWEEFAKILISRGEWEGALYSFLKMNEVHPKDIDVYYNIALTYKKMGEREKATEWAQKIIDLNPFKATEMNAFILNL